MGFPRFLFLFLLACSTSVLAAGGAVDLSIQPVPGEPEIQSGDTQASNPDGSPKTIKGPYLPVQLAIRNNSDDDEVTVAQVTFLLSGSLDEEDERFLIPLNPRLKIPAGGTETTEVFYLDNLPSRVASGQYVSMSISGWKNTGSDPGDEFTTGVGFKTR